MNATGEGDGSALIMVGYLHPFPISFPQLNGPALTNTTSDSIDDMTAGHHAGAATVLLVNEVNAHLAEHEHTDLCISRLDELIEVLENGFAGRVVGDEGGDTRRRAEAVLKGGQEV